MGTPGTDASTPPVGTDKAAARAAARARRRGGPGPDPHALARRALALLGGLPGPARVTCYASYGTEPDTTSLRRALAEAGYEVLLPRVVGEHLEWVLDGGTEQVSSMGIAEPVGPPVPLSPVRALLIPALAVTAAGARLGKGGGFYDRVLGGLAEPLPAVIAIVGDDDVVAQVPTDDHDRRVDAIVTATRTITCE